MGAQEIRDKANEYIAEKKPIFGKGRHKGEPVTIFKDTLSVRLSLDSYDCFDTQGTLGRGRTWLYRPLGK